MPRALILVAADAHRIGILPAIAAITLLAVGLTGVGIVGYLVTDVAHALRGWLR